MTGTTNVYWLEQTKDDVPVGNQWLSTAEKLRLTSLRFEKRRTDWSLGRWTAKCALASYLNVPIDFQSLRDIELRASPSGAPEVFLFNQRATVSVSISHRAGKALCVVGLSGTSLGCDLELVESRDRSFLNDFFSANEKQLVERSPAHERPLLTTLLWSAKESALKALRVGLRFSTTCFEVDPADVAASLPKRWQSANCTDWSPLLVRRIGGGILRGCWRCTNNMVRTVVFNSWQ